MTVKEDRKLVFESESTKQYLKTKNEKKNMVL